MEFGSFAEAAKHMLTLKIENQHNALDEAAKIVQTEAKALIGEYQPDAPPFAAWPELADSTKEDRARQGYSENDPLLRTGDMRDSIERVVGQDMAVVGSAEDVALYQEMGTAKTPPRSFLGMAAVNKGEDVANVLGRGVMAMMVPGGATAVMKLKAP